jgi:hypothetical protein
MSVPWFRGLPATVSRKARWSAFGCDTVSLATAPLGKLPLDLAFALRERPRAWVRTERAGERTAGKGR